MRDELLHVAHEYSKASKEPFPGHPLAKFIREDAASAAEQVLGNGSGFVVKGSPGMGNWAEWPWIGVFDPAASESAQEGFYVVYLYSRDLSRIVLSLAQGATAVVTEFGPTEGCNHLRERAKLGQARVPEHRARFSEVKIDLEGQGPSSKGTQYEASHIFGVTYQAAQMPTEGQLQSDLLEITELYRLLILRGGLEHLGSRDIEETALAESFAGGNNKQFDEGKRRARVHRSLERSQSLIAAVKRLHGYVCMCCGLEFERFYGRLGADYIEAHHLIPLSELAQSGPVRLSPETDFAVLCANCHRMIHRMSPPDLAVLRSIVLSHARPPTTQAHSP